MICYQSITCSCFVCLFLPLLETKMSNFTKYENKKQGFEVTKDDREREEQEKKRDQLMAKVSKLDLKKVELEYETLNKASYLAPHQRERRHFLQQAIAILRRQEAEELAKAQQEIIKSNKAEAVIATASAAQQSSKKRSREGEDSDDDDLLGARQQRPTRQTEASVAISSSAWANAIESFSAATTTVRSAPAVVVQQMGSRADSSSGAVGFVPRVVMQQRRIALQQDNNVQTVDNSITRPSVTPTAADDEINSFLDDLL